LQDYWLIGKWSKAGTTKSNLQDVERHESIKPHQQNPSSGRQSLQTMAPQQEAFIKKVY
jgi:hypothetical protein